MSDWYVHYMYIYHMHIYFFITQKLENAMLYVFENKQF